MAQATLNPVLLRLRGKVGDLIFKNVNGKTVVACKAAMPAYPETERQRATRQNFRKGIIYGKTVMSDPSMRPVYAEAAKRRGEPIYSVMISDFMNPPVVDEIDLSRYNGGAGNEIMVRASDDFGVIGVEVRVLNTDGEEIEKGAAVQSVPNSGAWVYTATVSIPPGGPVRVEAIAKDRPGNTGVRVESKG